MKFILITILFTVIALENLPAQNESNHDAIFSASFIGRIDSVISHRMNIENLPGVAVGVWITGEGEYVSAMGLADLNTNLPRDVNSPFRIANITKTFIATAVLKLVSAGTLNKAEMLSTWYPSFPNAGEITIDYLLRMRSGIYDSVDDEVLKLYYENPLINLNADSLINRSAKNRNQFIQPDSRTEYCNLNYIILEQIVEKVTGKNISDYLKEIIFDPLGLQNTFYPLSNDDGLPGTLRGYSWNSSLKKFEDKTVLNPELPGGAGAMISNISDLKIYAKALYTGEMLTPQLQKERIYSNPVDKAAKYVKYGEGIAQFGKFWGHNGTIMGFSSEMFYLPEKDAVIIISVNRLDEDDKSMSSHLFGDLTRLLFPDFVDW